MQPNLLEIEQLLPLWYQLALDNPLFVGAIVISVALVIILIYSMRLFGVKSRLRAMDKQRQIVQEQLTAAQEQLSLQEEKLNLAVEQMEEEQQASAALKAKSDERNQQIVQNVRSIANRFDLSEQLVATATEMKAEFIWQQQDNIVQQLAEQLEVARQDKLLLDAKYQQEMAQISEKDNAISALQASLEQQTHKFVQLETTLEEHKQVQHQLQMEAQDKLAATLAQHQQEFMQLVESLHAQGAVPAKAAVVSKVAEPVEAPAKPAVEAPVLPAIEPELMADVVTPEPAIVVASEPVVAVDPEPAFGVNVQAEQRNEREPTIDVIKPEPVASEQHEPDNDKVSGMFNKFFKKDPAEKPVQEPVFKSVAPQVEPEPSLQVAAEPVVEAVVSHAQAAVKSAGVLGGFFGKNKQDKKSTPIEPQVNYVPEPPVNQSVASPEPEIIEPDFSGPDLNIMGKMQGLFKKSKK